jgi:hypothetical protein
MTPKQADRLIASRAPVVLVWHGPNEHGVFQIASRDRWCVNCTDGTRFDRSSISEVHPL